MALGLLINGRGCILLLACMLCLALAWHNANADTVDPADVESSIRALWTWQCVDEKCKKTLADHDHQKSFAPDEDEGKNKSFSSLNVCKVFCGDPKGSLWPLPMGPVQIKGPMVKINSNNIDIETATVSSKDMNWKTADLIHELRKTFTAKWTAEDAARSIQPGGSGLLITLIVKDPDHTSLTLETDESYQLEVINAPNKVRATITAETFFGVRHGVETLGQLLVYDDASRSRVVPGDVWIFDKPAYKYRALTLDTSRNFISVDRIKKNLDAMAANKLNVLHWHITDTHSFPLESKTFPNLTAYGAYNHKKIYRQSDISELVHYARVRGVKIVPEFDAPAHVGEGWQWAPPGALLCFNAQPWLQNCVEPPCGQLNPVSEDVYRILEGIYKDIFTAFDSPDIFHMGGDEVHFKCWRDNEQIAEFLKEKSWDKNNDTSFLRLWNVFQSRAYDLVKETSGGSPLVILWTSTLTTGPLLEEFLDKEKYVIQIWTKGTDPAVKELIEKGYRVIFSNYDALYLDCGYGGWVTDGNNWCSPYIPWQKLYLNDPVALIKEVTGESFRPEMADQVLGQSAALWTEQADDESVDGRLWPRAAALAERLWSNPKTASWKEAEGRLLNQRERLVNLGVRAEALQPQWCLHNEGECPL